MNPKLKPNQTFAAINLPAVSSRPNDMRGIDRARDNIYNVFGENAVLLAVPADAAAKMLVAANALTLEQTRVVAHQVRLTRENIAVACGRGLRAIYFATPAAQKDFLKSNPRL